MLLTILICLGIAHADVAGRVAAVQGDVQIESSVLGRTAKAILGQDVSEGDVLRVGADGSAKFIAYDENELNVLANSVVRFTKYNSDLHVVELALDSGRARLVAHQQYDGEKTKCELKTPNAEVSIKGTDFLLQYETAPKKTTVTTFTGTVALRGTKSGDPTSVGSGQSANVKNGTVSRSKLLDRGDLIRLDKESALSTMSPTSPKAVDQPAQKKRRKRQIQVQ